MSDFAFLEDEAKALKFKALEFIDSWQCDLDSTRSIAELNAAEQGLCKCDCCGYFTLLNKGQAERCGVCAWMDESGSQVKLNRSGLAQAKVWFKRYGACRQDLCCRTRQVRALELQPSPRF